MSKREGDTELFTWSWVRGAHTQKGHTVVSVPKYLIRDVEGALEQYRHFC